MAHPATSPDQSVLIGSTAEIRNDQARPVALSELIDEAARAAFVKKHLAAAHLGRHHSNFNRSVREGTLRIEELEALGVPFLGRLGGLMVKHYDVGARVDPREQAIELIPELVRQILKAVK